MESRIENKPESNHQDVIQGLKDRLAQIQERRKILAQEKEELLKTVKAQRDKLDKQQEHLMAPEKNKPAEFQKSLENLIRKNVYFYDYLPISLSVMQINFSSNKESVVGELKEIAKSAENFKDQMEQNKLQFDKLYKDLDELAKKPDQVELELINEENQIVQKIYEARVSSVVFFKPKNSFNEKLEINLSSELKEDVSKPKIG